MSTLGGLLASMYKSDREWANGKIQRMPNLWIYADVPGIAAEMRASSKKLLITDDGMYKLKDNGILIVLIKRKAVLCSNIKLWPDAYVNNGVAWIMDSTCRKCEHYLAAKRGVKYSRCAWARNQRCGDMSPNQVAAKETLATVSAAAKTVAEIMT